MWKYLEQVQNAPFSGDYFAIDLSSWLTWILGLVVIAFLLPSIIVIFYYITSMVLYFYEIYLLKLQRQYGPLENTWNGARDVVSSIWDVVGWLWHGYEIQGLENIPEKGPALLVYYHGATPLDHCYFVVKVVLLKNRVINNVVDKFLFKIPGLATFLKGINATPGSVEMCSNVLKEGNMLAIAPGGVYESQFSQQYELMWKKRLGFAKVALDAKVPVIPIFTENTREAFRTVGIGRNFFLKVYEKLKLPLTPIYGGFPVKMTAHVGKPIPYDPNLTPEQLHDKVFLAVQELIAEHQRMPGNIFYAMLDRIPYFRHQRRLKPPKKVL